MVDVYGFAPGQRIWLPVAGKRVVFTVAGGATWQGKKLDDAGIYSTTLGASSAGVPVRVVDAKSVAPSWGYSDPATEFLVGEF